MTYAVPTHDLADLYARLWRGETLTAAERDLMATPSPQLGELLAGNLPDAWFGSVAQHHKRELVGLDGFAAILMEHDIPEARAWEILGAYCAAARAVALEEVGEAVADEQQGESLVAQMCAYLSGPDFQATTQGEMYGHLSRQFPAATLAQVLQAFGTLQSCMLADLAEASPEERAEMGAALTADEAETVRTGAAFPDLVEVVPELAEQGGPPTLEQEARGWLIAFEATGARLTYDREAGFSYALSNVRQPTYPLAFLQWLANAEQRQPGISRRVRELALGFDDMLIAACNAPDPQQATV